MQIQLSKVHRAKTNEKYFPFLEYVHGKTLARM